MRFAPLALAAVCFLTLFVGLGTVGYLEVREARDALVAEEVRAGREYLTPLVAHRPLYDKPYPGYLPELLTHDFDTESPVASRQLRAALAVLLVLLTAWIGAAAFGPRAGVAAGLVLASSLALPLAARTDAAQLLATLAAWIATGIFAHRMFSDIPASASRTRRLLADSTLPIAYLALGAAAMFGGPLPALWPMAGAALYARLSGRGDRWRSLRPLAGLAIIAAIAIPWYAAMTERHGGAFLSRMLFFPYGANASGPWYAGVVLTVSLMVAGAFPWSALLPAAFTHAALRWRTLTLAVRGRAQVDLEALVHEERDERLAHFYIACLVAALAPIAFYPLPPISASLPAVPAVALVCGRFVDHLAEDPKRLRGVFTRACLMLGITGTVVAIALSAAGSRLTVLFPGIRWAAPFALLSCWAPFLAHFFLRRSTLAAMLFALPMALGVPLFSWRLLPELEDFMSVRRAAEAMNVASPENTPLAVFDDPPATMRLYLARNPVRIDSLAQLSGLRATDGYAYLAFPPSLEKRTARDLATPIEVLARTPLLVLARTPRPAVTATAGAAPDPGATEAPRAAPRSP